MSPRRSIRLAGPPPGVQPRGYRVAAGESIIHSMDSLASFLPFIHAVDSHASHRLALAERAQALLAESSPSPDAERLALADRLERWRYQHWGERICAWTGEDQRLSDALDLAAHRLRGGPARPPRQSRSAVAARDDDPAHAEARRWLDPATDLEQLIARAAELTARHFSVSRPDGTSARRMRLYAPIYLASDCVNDCPYCGFGHALEVPRRRLSVDEVRHEAGILRGRGIRNVLLVAGDFPAHITTGYLGEIVGSLRDSGMTVAIEIAPQSTASYRALVAAGVCGLTLYQETYDEKLYATYHRRGPKASFPWRLEAPERAAEAGMPRLGLGILLGLADAADDLRRLIRHAEYLRRRFRDRTLAFSLPRIHDAPPRFHIPFPVADETFIRLCCVLRIAFPAAELVLSTREPAELRNRLAQICVTEMSAGSSTAPGGYSEPATHGGQQFPIADHRPPREVAGWLADRGFSVDAGGEATHSNTR